MKDLIKLISKSKTFSLIFGICAVILASGVSWALIKADKVSFQSEKVKIELSSSND